MDAITSGSPYVLMWLFLIIVLVLIEFLTVGLFTIWFAIGAVAAVFLAYWKFSFMTQVAVFLAIAAVLLFFTRPLALKYVNRKATKTNVDRYMGKKAIVTETVNNLEQTGRGNVDSMDWRLAAENDTDIIEQGSLVEVLRVSGSKLIVKPYKED